MLSVEDKDGYSVYSDVDGLLERDPDTTVQDAIRKSMNARNNFDDKPTPGVELCEFWGDFEVEVDGETTCYRNFTLVMANGEKIIRFEPNPYHHGMPPWDLWVWRKAPGEVYGIGVLEPILPLNDALQVVHNQAIEVRGLEAQPIFEAKIGGILDIDSIRVFPGAIYPTLDGNSIRKIDIGNSSSAAMDQIGFLLAQINDITGAMRAYTTENNQKSATEISAIAGMNNAVNAEGVRYTENTLMLKILRRQLQLHQQFMSREIQIRLLNPSGGNFHDPVTGQLMTSPPFLEVTPADIQGEFDFTVSGASWLASRQSLAEAMNTLTQPIMQNQQLSGWLKPDKFINKMYQGFGIRDAWEFVKTPEEYYAEQQAAQDPMAGQPGSPYPGGQSGDPNAQGGAPGGGAPSMAGVPDGGSGPPTAVSRGQMDGPQLPT
jgi:hypothetical protein